MYGLVCSCVYNQEPAMQSFGTVSHARFTHCRHWWPSRDTSAYRIVVRISLVSMKRSWLGAHARRAQGGHGLVRTRGAHREFMAWCAREARTESSWLMRTRGAHREVMAWCAREVRTGSSWLETHAKCIRRDLRYVNWIIINSLLSISQQTTFRAKKNSQSECAAIEHLFS